MARARIPKVTPFMISNQPDQVAAIINAIIDKVNEE